MHLFLHALRWLVQSIRHAWRAQEADPTDVADRPQPWPVWLGQWHAAGDGIFETRASVARCDEGFLPHLEIPQCGGDSGSGGYGSPDGVVPTLAEAIAIAKAREAAWHIQVNPRFVDA